jgi:uncharacterized repeat protein (TIGR01451 family)
MKKVTLFASATVVSTLVATAIAAPAFACHPVGSIIKEVQDQTTGSKLVDANTVASALGVNSGDTLVYSITVKNSGAAAGDGDDDMSDVVLTDTLPGGVQMVSDPSQTAISENLGTITPGKSVTRTYTVKVTSTTNGAVNSNTACFTGKSNDNSNNQEGCDTAVVTVKVPTPTPAPTPTPTPATTLPDTGSTALSASLIGISSIALGYALNTLRLKFRGNA